MSIGNVPFLVSGRPANTYVQGLTFSSELYVETINVSGLRPSSRVQGCAAARISDGRLFRHPLTFKGVDLCGGPRCDPDFDQQTQLSLLLAQSGDLEGA